MAIDLRLRYDRATKERAATMFAEGLRPAAVAAATGAPADTVREWELTYRACGRDVLLNMGKKCPTYDYETRLAVAREVVDGGVDAGRGDGQARRGEPPHGQAVVPPVPRGRRGGAPSQVRGQAARIGREGGPEDPRAGARDPRPEARGAGRVPKKIDSPEGGEALPNREKALAVAELSGQGHALADLLEAAGLARSSYYYALAHPRRPTRHELRPRVAEIFGRLPNGVGHRQVAMELRAVDGVRVADKTVLKVMNEMGLRCRIRKETGRHRYSSYRGAVGETFENVIGRDFSADGPWQKLGTDVTEFKLSFGRAYLAPAYDFGSKEIVAWSISEHPDLAQQEEMLEALMAAKPEGASPVMHSDMGWQYQHDLYVSALRGNGFTQSMSRKGNCIDNGATEQVFGHLKDEFSRGRDWDAFESFKADLEAYIHHWNHVRRQKKLGGLTPVEFRERALREAA